MGASTSASTAKSTTRQCRGITLIMTVHTTANIANIQKEQVVTGTNCAPDSAKYVRKSKIPVALVLVKRGAEKQNLCVTANATMRKRNRKKSTIMLEEEEEGRIVLDLYRNNSGERTNEEILESARNFLEKEV